MKALFTSIMSRFNATTGTPAAHNAAWTALGGRLYLNTAPEGAATPYGVFMLVSAVPDETFTETMESCLIQVSLFSTAPSAVEITDAAEAVKALFDWCALTVTGYRSLYMRREGGQLLKDEGLGGEMVWHYILEYRVLIEKT